jgi:ribonuclease D
VKKPPAAIMELLRVLLKHVTDEQNIAPRLIASADDLELLARDDNAPIRALTGWRREVFGATALKLKHGEIALAVKHGRIRLITDIDPAS